MKVKHIVLALIPMLLVFLILGQLRSGSDVIFSSLLSILSHNEFEAVFGTLFDYNQNARMGQPMAIPFIQTWLADFQNIIPQQFLPYEKIDISHTYTMAYIPEFHAIGGGFPGGTLLEAIIGLGLYDAFLKGAIVGTVSGYIYKKCMIEKRTYMKSAMYIWIVVLSYKTFARGTFSLVPQFLYDFLVPVATIAILSSIMKGALRPIRSSLKEIENSGH